MERAEAEAIYDQGREVVVAVLLRMAEQIQRLTERVARQEERIGELERRLGRNSRNSSMPPSQDPPGSAPKRGTGRSGRAQGGQLGHEGHGRPLLPAWVVDEVIDHWPERCACGHVFGDAERLAAGEAARHQVEELPVMATHVTEHRCQRVCCPDCGARQTGLLPAEVAASAFGPSLQAAIVTLSVRNRISRGDVVECCEQLFSARISTGSVEAILQRAGDALEQPYAQLLAAVRRARHVNMDETGWRLRGQRRFLWGAFGARHAVLRIMADRDADRVWELLGSSTATVTSDRWWAYDQLPLRRRQVCWAHLKRDFAPTPTASALNASSASTAFASATSCSGRGRSTSTPATVANCNAASCGCGASSSRSCAATPPRPRATSARAASRATCSSSGPRFGPSPPRPASSPPQPRRARAARRRHLPQARVRQPINRRRAPARTPALRPHDLPDRVHCPRGRNPGSD